LLLLLERRLRRRGEIRIIVIASANIDGNRVNESGVLPSAAMVAGRDAKALMQAETLI
jgi:hypothetical protein